MAEYCIRAFDTTRLAHYSHSAQSPGYPSYHNMTSEPFDLGTIIEVPPDKGVQPPQTFEDIMAALDMIGFPDDEVAKKAVHDNKDQPSIWFVDFPDQAAADQPQLLQKYMQSIQDYRCWASVVWWSNAFGCPKIPQDGNLSSVAARSAYCAKVGVKHMRGTPWYIIIFS